MNWDDPIQRAELINRVGPTEYNRLIQKHFEASTVAIVNGYRIRPVGSRFGRLYLVSGTNGAFRELEEAKKFAALRAPGKARLPASPDTDEGAPVK